MAPEVLRSEQYTSKADVWSLGVMIYEALYSHCPWEGRNINHLLDKISRNSLRFAP